MLLVLGNPLETTTGIVTSIADPFRIRQWRLVTASCNACFDRGREANICRAVGSEPEYLRTLSILGGSFCRSLSSFADKQPGKFKREPVIPFSSVPMLASCNGRFDIRCSFEGPSRRRRRPYRKTTDSLCSGMEKAWYGPGRK